MNLRLYNYNNYYNRKVKILNKTDEEFSQFIYEIPKANFNPNDNVMTTHIFGNNVSQYDGNADYLVVTNEFNDIVSRWFIIEQERLRGGQWKITLRHDLVADFYNNIIDAPCFIEKAIANNNDIAIYNSEDMTFNQIKTSEKKLRDNTLCPWLVGYIARNTQNKKIEFSTPTAYIADYENLSDIPLYNYFSDGKFNEYIDSPKSLSIGYFLEGLQTPETGISRDHKVTFNNAGLEKDEIVTDVIYKGISGTSDYAGIAVYAADYFRRNEILFLNHALAEPGNVASTAVSTQFLETYPEGDGIIVKINSTDKYYRIKRTGKHRVRRTITPSQNGALYNDFINLVKENPLLTLHTSGNNVPTNQNFTYALSIYKHSISIEEVTPGGTYSFTLPSESARTHLSDAPYDMVAIPYNIDSNLSVAKGDYTHIIENTNADVGMLLASKLIESLGESAYDFQLLPYCPNQSIYKMFGINFIGFLNLEPDIMVEGRDYAFVTDGEGNKVSVVLFPNKMSQSFIIKNIYTPVLNGDTTYEPASITIGDKKLTNECDMWRLVSPNYNGQFEFNAAKNDGVDYFQVDFSYKPYKPYIRVSPNFKGLYGEQFNDARGLICNGDFSLPILTPAWTTYENNNKNYQISFDRQIESMELQNKWNKVGDITRAITGTFSGGISGAFTGGMIGGVPGAIIGGATGTIASGVAGGVDAYTNQILRNDALDLTKDQFGYALGNIKAMPISLTRVSSFNINNKVFPILEYYTCSDTEKEALKNKIKYNGMTIMRIDKIRTYLFNKYENAPAYIKGKLIRLEGLGDDFHIINEIANEINKGVYIL